MKSHNVSQECINDLCNTIDGTVATVHKKYTGLDWKIEI